MYSSIPNARTRMSMGGEQLTIMFEHCTDQPYYADSGSGSGSGRSSPSTSLPCTPVDLFPHSPLDVALAAEDSWNLIPYDVPWGPEYYHYRAGTLPGPEGACIFLRSPTPLKNRRTQKACNKCRQRKAKCSGSRPACTRCIARGYVCEYVEEDPKRTAPHNASRARRQRAHSECSSEPTETADSLSDCDASDYLQPKEEPGLLTPELSFADADADADAYSPPAGYHHHPHAHYPALAVAAYEFDGAAATDTYHEPAALGDYYEHAAYADGAAYFSPPPAGPGASSQMYHHHHEATDPHSAAAPSASVHAPRPVRCTGSPAFLAPGEQMGMGGAFDAHTHAHQHARALQHHHDPMLISLAAADEAAAAQMSLPQVPLIGPSADPALEAAAGAVGYAQQPEMYYYPAAGEPAMQFPYLQYQYAVPAYEPAAGGQDELAPATLYTMPMSMPMLPVGMMA